MKFVRLLTCLLSFSSGCAKFDSYTAEIHLDSFFEETNSATLESNLRSEAQSSSSAAYLLAELLNETGRPQEAFLLYMNVLTDAITDAAVSLEATASAMSVVAMRDRIRDIEVSLNQFLSHPSLPGNLPAEALFQLRHLQFSYSLHRGDAALSKQQLQQSNCLASWQIAGPFAIDAETFFVTPMLETAVQWPTVVPETDMEAPIPVIAHTSQHCRIVSPSRSRPVNGGVLARTDLLLPQQETLLFRMETDADVQVFINGTSVWQKDRKEAWPAVVEWWKQRLSSGNHSIVVKLHSVHSAPVFSLVIVRETDTFVSTSPADTKRHFLPSPPSPAISESLYPPDAPLRASQHHALLKILNWYGDWKNLWKFASEMDSSVPQNAVTISDILLSLPWIPGDIAMENSRQLLHSIMETHPEFYRSLLFLSQNEYSEGRDAQAMRILENAVHLFPLEPDVLFAMIERLYNEQRFTDASRFLNQAEHLLGESCRLHRWRYLLSLQMDLPDSLREHARNLSRCQVTSFALSEELVRAGEFEEAAVHTEKVARLRPDDPGLQVETGLYWLRANHAEAAVGHMREALSRFPWYSTARSTLVEFERSGGEPNHAVDLIHEGMALFPSDELFGTMLHMGENNTPFRINGSSILKTYQQEKREVPGEAVWILDRVLNIIQPSGARIQMTHWLLKFLSHRSIQEMGEVEISPDERILTMRTIRQDGQILYPERIAGKTSISFPGIAPGDIGEFESVRFFPLRDEQKIGFDTGRFYFQDFDTWFHRSEIVIIAPSSTNLILDPRGNVPDGKILSSGNMKSILFQMRNMPPLPMETAAPSPSEFLPSIRVLSNRSLRDSCLELRDSIRRKNRSDPEMIEWLNRQILSRKPQMSTTETANAIYNWILENVEHYPGFHEESSHIFRRQKGNRARLFQTLINAADIRSELFRVLPLGEDETNVELADLSLFSDVLIRVGDQMIFLDADYTPYGFIPGYLRERPAISLESCQLQQTEKGTPSMDSVRIQASFIVDQGGKAVGTIETILKGEDALQWRIALHGTPRSEWVSLLHEHMLSHSLPGAALLSYQIENLDTPHLPLKFVYATDHSRFVTVSDNRHSITLPFQPRLTERTGGRISRTIPLIMGLYASTDVDVRIHLPHNISLDERHIRKVHRRITEGAMGEFSFSVSQVRETEIRIQETFHMTASRVPPEHYTSTLDFLNAREQCYQSEITYKIK